MLVLARKLNQFIVLKHATTGEVIQFGVARISDNATRLAIDAPGCWNVVREEIEADPLTTTQSLARQRREDFRKKMAVQRPWRHKIQADESDIADLGRRRSEFLEADEVEDAYPVGEGCENG